MQSHLGGDVGKALHQEVRRAHPGLDRTEGVLDRLAPHPHQAGVRVEPRLDLLDQVLVQPARDPLERTARTSLRILRALRRFRYPTIISTKSDLVASDEYLATLKGGQFVYPYVVCAGLMSRILGKEVLRTIPTLGLAGRPQAVQRTGYHAEGPPQRGGFRRKFDTLPDAARHAHCRSKAGVS